MKSQFKNDNKYKYIFTRIVFPILFLLVILFTFVKTTQAGLISLVNSLFGGEEASARINQIPSVANSQTISILQAHANINPTSDIFADITPISNGEILIAELASIDLGEADTSNTQISTYIVQQGDTISSIAKMFRVSVNTILWANDLNSKSVLKSGQTLVILPVTGISHVVKKGDTVKSIAKAYNADPSDIYSYNDLNTTSVLNVGQKLIIPNADFVITPVRQTTRGLVRIAPPEPLIGDVWNWPSYSGYYSCPINGGRLTQKLHGRNGIDFADPIGTPLYASASGIVIISKSNNAYNGGYGNFVVISHDNSTQTLYSHMSRSVVSVGTQVNKGQLIGYIGITGLTTGPHIHFEIRGAQNPFKNIPLGGSCN